MAFELVNTIDKAWRTVEDSNFLSCKTVFLYYDDLYSRTEALDIAYESLHPGNKLPGSPSQASTELHSLSRAKRDERRYRHMMAAADDLERKNRNELALNALSLPVSSGGSPNPWVHNAHLGPPQDVARYYRELAPISLPRKKLKASGKFQNLPPTETQDGMSRDEQFFLKLAEEAGGLSGHSNLLITQKTKGWCKF